ncbi:hypothetical protein Q9L58_009465 [Maublancomyces gigas]|uniref:Uncharacterized protein n=1 Tax=Discina gigas TaxID=1032678 RepID=A0ABR3G776_9PEZI
MCMRVVERYAVCKCVYFTHGIDQCSAYGRRGHLVQDKLAVRAVAFGPFQSRPEASAVATVTVEATPSIPTQISTSQVAGNQSPHTAPKPVEQLKQKTAQDDKRRKVEGKSKNRFPLTEGNISFYYRNYE